MAIGHPVSSCGLHGVAVAAAVTAVELDNHADRYIKATKEENKKNYL